MDVEPKKQGPTQKHPKNKHSQEQAPKKQGLSVFFTYDYQSDLIHYAQMLDPSYEGALIEYWGIFTAHLIKCFEADRESGNITKLYDNVRRVLKCVEKDESKKGITLSGETHGVSIISEMFALIGSAYHRWTTCDLGTAIIIMNKILNETINIATIPNYTLPFESVLYRGRTSEKQLDKADMFHIPFMQAYKIRNQRFSITGQPLLYLTDHVFGVLNELDIQTRDEYEKLHVVQYRTNNSFDKIADMTITGNFEHIDDPNIFRQYFCRFILSCTCSFPNIRGRDKSYFVEEYVIPQLVTQLLTNDFRGIRYNTINGYRNDKNNLLPNDYVNYAFFTKQKSNEPVDEELRKNFIIDGPITVSRLDVYNPSENYSISKIVDIIVSHFGRVKCFNLLLSELENNEYYRNFKDEKQLLFKDGQYRYIRVESRDADK